MIWYIFINRRASSSYRENGVWLLVVGHTGMASYCTYIPRGTCSLSNWWYHILITHSTSLQECFLKSLFQLLRCGKVREAQEYCTRSKNYWLAATLLGSSHPRYEATTAVEETEGMDMEGREEGRVRWFYSLIIQYYWWFEARRGPLMSLIFIIGLLRTML